MRKNYSTAVAVLMLILAVTLVACAGAEPPTPTPEPTNTPAPTNTPQPTNTPAPTVDVQSLTVDDFQATKTALEVELERLEREASAASGSEDANYFFQIENVNDEIATLDALIQGMGGAESMESTESTEGGEAAMATVALALSGDFAEARAWTWDELEALGTMTAEVAGPRDDDPASEYTGVSLMAVLESAGVGEDAETLVATASDGFEAEIELAAAQTCEECMIVLEDETLRLIMPGFPSNNWVRDVVSLEAK